MVGGIDIDGAWPGSGLTDDGTFTGGMIVGRVIVN